ncbi:MAG TPA: TrkA family potassium uptake protein [Myxococcota bacterium]|nr:TrkA family potassium uptake protein [Myxococcota bacterium]
MRVTFVGASHLAVHTARLLIERGHEVVLIDEDHETIERLSDELDCGLVVGDGSRPAVLEQLAPEKTDHLLCVSDRDEANILAALVGRELGCARVVPKVDDPELEPICAKLGLDEVIVPDREIALRLVDEVEGRSSPELTTVVQSGLRFLSFAIPEGVSDLASLELPSGARAIARNRDDESALVDDDSRFEEGDVLVVIAEEDALETLRKRFSPETKAGDDAD